MASETVRVLRILEYVGPRDWVEDTIDRCYVKGTWSPSAGKSIRSAIVGEYPEILTAQDETA